MSIKIVASPVEANDCISSIIADAKQSNPLAPIMFVTDNYRQGGKLVNQFISAYLDKSEAKSVVGLSQITLTDLIQKLCDKLEIDWSRAKYETALYEVVSAKLYSGSTFLEPTKLIPTTVHSIQRLVSNYCWIDFEDADLIAQVSNSKATRTSKDLFELAKEIDEDLASREILSPAKVLKVCLQPNNEQILASFIQETTFLVFAQALPESAVKLFNQIVKKDNLGFVFLGPVAQEVGNLQSKFEHYSFPDVMTEVRHATSKVIEYIQEGARAEDVAILYSDEGDYARHLKFALDNAGISWTGKDTDAMSATKMAALVLDVLSMSSSASQRKLDRKFLLRVIRSGLLRRPENFPANHSWTNIERFIREKGLFNNAENWIPQLETLASQLPSLEKELKELEKSPEDFEDPIKTLRRSVSESRSAAALLNIIQVCEKYIGPEGSLRAGRSEQEVMMSLIELINQIVGNVDKRRISDSDRECLDGLVQLGNQLSTHPVAIASSVLPSLIAKIEQLFATGGSYRTGPGIFVGQINQHPLRQIKFQVLLGVSDGAFPKRRQEDPLSPDALRIALGPDYANVLPSSSKQTQDEIRSGVSLLSGAKRAVVSFSRSGLIGLGSGNPSSDVRSLIGTEVPINSFEQLVDFSANAVLPIDVARKSQLASMTGSSNDRASYPGLDSLVALMGNEFGSFTGKVGSSQETFNFDNSLSASAIETYLKCPHKFFVTKILGFRFEDDEDEVEVLRALDFGTIVHKSFELLHQHCVETQMMPDFGEPYSTAAVEKFKEIFNSQCDDAIQRGQAGWRPLFEQKRRNFLNLTSLYFKLEHEFRSMAPKAKSNSPEIPIREDFKLRPHLAEFSYDSQGVLPLEIKVLSSDNVTRTLKFKGQMDRVDKSRSDIHAGVIDFKTGKASRLVAAKKELIQDLLYSYALRENMVDFANVQYVSFAYITLNTPKESRIVGLRDVDKGLYVDDTVGGYSGLDLLERIRLNNMDADDELKTVLRGFVDANERGIFPPFSGSSTSSNCEVCAKSFGEKRAAQIFKNSLA